MNRRKFDKEFKTTIVDLIVSGKKVSDIVREYDIDTGTINRWRREFESEIGSFKDEATVGLRTRNTNLKKTVERCSNGT